MNDNNMKAISVVQFENDTFTILGFLDFFDIATYILSIAPDSKDMKEKESVEKAKKVLKDSKAIDVVNISVFDPFVAYNIKENFSKIVYALTKFHRVPIYNENYIVTIFSQRDVLKLIYKNEDKFKNFLEKKKIIDYKEFKLSKIFKVHKNEKMLKALEILKENKITGLPVVNDKEEVVANFSVTDLKKFLVDDWMSFDLTVSEYLHKYSKYDAIYLTKDDNLFDALKILIQKDISRVWIIDDKYYPIGVITLTSFLNFIVDN
jgi:CBS domain-containing protein